MENMVVGTHGGFWNRGWAGATKTRGLSGGHYQDPGEDSTGLDSSRVNKEERKVRADSIAKGRTGGHAGGERRKSR